MRDEYSQELTSRRTALISAADLAGRCFRLSGPPANEVFDYFFEKFCEELGIGRLVNAAKWSKPSPFRETDAPTGAEAV